MNLKELKELIDFLMAKDITEFELERGDVKVRLKRGAAPAVAMAGAAVPACAPAGASLAVAKPQSAAPPAPAATTDAAASEAAGEAGLHDLPSPIVGTFYAAASPGQPPFVKPGDSVQSGQVVCIIEAMKLMNEIESDANGTVVKCYVENGQPVEYGQPLFAIRPS